MGKINSQKLIGYRVKAARDSNGWTQDQLADALELKDRQSVSDIENGKRSLRPDELVQLSEVLSRDIEFFLDPFNIAGEAQFSWRASKEIEEKNLDNFEITAGKWIGLFRWLRESNQDTNPLKESLRLTKQSTYEDAIICAENLVKKFELGEIPTKKLISFIEEKLDIPILFVDTINTPAGHSVSGACCHLKDFSIILINRNEPEGRIYYDLAHELFHVLTWDVMEPSHRESNSYEDRSRNVRIEQLADNFAAALLMPESSLKRLIKEPQRNNINDLLQIATKFKVSSTALAWRLFNLKWINENIRNKLIVERQGSSIMPPKPFSEKFVKSLHAALDSGRLSARKAAKAMSMSLMELQGLFGEYSLAVPFDL